jgi:FecR protein
VTTLQGTATVARASTPEPAPLKFKDEVFVQDRIVTGESSTVRILLGGKAVITVRERSTLTISETPTTSTVEVGAGKIALAVAKDRMKPGESVEIKTPNAVAGVRGTVVIAEVDGVQGSHNSRFTLLTGIVDVTLLDPAGRPTGARVTLMPLQGVGVTSRLGAVRNLSRNEAQSIASDYKVSVPTPPPAANTQVMERQIEQAVQHTTALATDRAKNKDRGSNERDDSDKSGDKSKDRKNDKADKSDKATNEPSTVPGGGRRGSDGPGAGPGPGNGPGPIGGDRSTPAPTVPIIGGGDRPGGPVTRLDDAVRNRNKNKEKPPRRP